LIEVKCNRERHEPQWIYLEVAASCKGKSGRA
jgi:hypothetical protein